jgi:hypothetical protein
MIETVIQVKFADGSVRLLRTSPDYATSASILLHKHVEPGEMEDSRWCLHY